jgi:hypothetical protein
MLLMLGAAFVVFAAKHVEPWLERRPWLDLVLLVPVALLAWDMTRFSQTPFGQAFWMTAPTIRSAPLFEHHEAAPVQYVRRDWAQPILLSMFANVGVVRCYGVDPNFVPHAVPVDSPSYRGPAFVLGAGPATATVREWTPNHALVEVSGAREGDVVVYDMNYEESWRADGQPALEVDGLVAGRLGPGRTRVDFRYFPRTLAWSVPLCLLTILVAFRGPELRARLRVLLAEAQRRFADRKVGT